MRFQPTGPMAKSSQLTRGFTLIELLVVIAIIAILGALAYPVYTGVLERAKATKDMSNLRQVGVATQTYMNDNDGVLPGSATNAWMSQLHPKYLAAWSIFQSPFDRRGSLEDDANSPVSYGINGNPTNSIIGASADKIINPSEFIVFAPAQAAGATVGFAPTSKANFGAPGVTVYKRRQQSQPELSLGPGGNYPCSASTAVMALQVRATSSVYDVIIGAGLLGDSGPRVRPLMPGRRCSIISDTNIAPLFANRVKESLEFARFEATLITIPAGEKSKTLEQAGAICEQMIAAGLDRQSFVIGLGGGVIGDISGFVAAI